MSADAESPPQRPKKSGALKLKIATLEATLTEQRQTITRQEDRIRHLEMERERIDDDIDRSVAYHVILSSALCPISL